MKDLVAQALVEVERIHGQRVANEAARNCVALCFVSRAVVCRRPHPRYRRRRRMHLRGQDRLDCAGSRTRLVSEMKAEANSGSGARSWVRATIECRRHRVH